MYDPWGLYLEKDAGGDENNVHVVVHAASWAGLQHVAELVGVGGEQGEVHHALRYCLLGGVQVDVKGHLALQEQGGSETG